MKNAKITMIGLSAGLAALAATVPAFAQDTANGQAQASGQAQVGMGLPGATPQATTAAPAAGGTDHSLVVGHLAVGYLGRTNIPVGNAGPGAGNVAAPIVGVRYWLDPGLGLDLGLGVGITGGSNDPAADPPSAWGFALHGGVPLALASGRHYTFEIIPELNVGLGGGTGNMGGVDIAHKGFMLDIGARAGAEIQFGFIGIPELALQGSIGARFELSNVSSEPDGAAQSSSSSYRFGTTVFADPWAIFTNSVSALYYF